MPEIEFKIDAETGKCETEIKGVSGAVCEKTAGQLRKLLGTPKVDRKTVEYHINPQTKQQIKGK